ncbi:glycosyltransferase family 2 protein [Clostridium perfringens]|nr:glycosyltransferase family 2 protein [Clostridium perfringens]
MKECLVSIITPCFNSEKTIARTIESVLNQTYKNIEYIIIDGASTDNTIKIIEKYKKNFGERIRIISESDNGIYDAMNKGINLARGEIIGIINSDDWYENDCVEKVINKYKEYKEYEFCVIYGMVKEWEQNIIRRISFKSHKFINNQMIAHPTCFITKKVYEKYGGFNLLYKSSADYELILRFTLNDNIKFIPIYECLANFLLGGTSSGQLGVRETAIIRYRNGIISKRQYYFKLIKSYAYEILVLKKGIKIWK